ncbi:hypothetical protein A4A49_26757 [Nicotiana attenuata]|uniref:Uncharacterized protein n=1 Tax=Nicotiana attenuata TaxID=49451 RepID=A0A1J6K9L6_NICAT|nr:hypothetical protein A4A49_26757 [Nicotiana attenuata]
MTREYADWWSARRVHSSRQSTHIISKVPRKDDIPLSSKDDQRQKNTHEGSSKSKLRSKDPSPNTKVLSKSTPSTGGDAHLDKGAKHVLLTSKTTTATVEVMNNPCKRKVPPTSPNKDVAKTTNVVPTNKEMTQASALLNEIVNVSVTSSSNESDISHDIHWSRSKKKAKDTSHSEFADLDALSIDIGFFVEGDPSSTKPLSELEKRLGVDELYDDVLGGNMVEDCVTSPNSLSVAAKSPHTSFDGVEHHAANNAPLKDLSLPKESHLVLPEDAMLSKPAMTSKMEVAASQAKRQKTFEPTPWPLHLDAPNFKPQETISRIKLSFVNTMWHTLCEWIKKFSLDSLDSFTKLEESIALTLEEIKKENVIDSSTLEALVEAFFTTYADYDTLRSSKMTKEFHRESLSDARQRLDDAKQEYKK